MINSLANPVPKRAVPIAATMAGDLTGRKQIEPDVLDWIIRK